MYRKVFCIGLLSIFCAAAPPSIVSAGGFDSDSGLMSLGTNADSSFVLHLDTVSGDPGEVINYQVSLSNDQSVEAFRLLIHHDPIALIAHEATLTGTRAADFEYFVAEFDADGTPGDIRLVATADMTPAYKADPISAGTGPIASIRFRISSQLAFSGMSAPVRFVVDEPTNNELTTGDGTVIAQEDLVLIDGYVYIDSLGEKNIGDINLNGIEAEIGDAIYFSNYFINPFQYPLNPLQMANSDVNDDGLVGTVADLVALINWIVSGQGTPKIDVDSWSVAQVRSYASDSGFTLDYTTDFAVGGLLVTADVTAGIDPSQVTVSGANNMDVLVRVENHQLRLLVYSLDGSAMPAGEQTLASITGLDHLEITGVELATAGGRTAEVEFVNGAATLPLGFELHQNYPNPFNPQTRIGLSLTQDSRVRLAVFDLLGRELRTLLDETLSSGDHSVVWDGRDQAGNAVASGVYFYRLETSAGSQARKMMLLK